jgi:Circularly permutated YpsA SLOG family
MLEQIISGGQTGADQAAGRPAVACGLATGGWMPQGFLTEEGPRPEFADLYGAIEMPTSDFRLRTEQNVRDSDATLWFGSTDTPGAKTTLNAVAGMNWPRMIVKPGDLIRASAVAAWLARNSGIKRLNVAGNRESKAPGIGDQVEQFLVAVFRRFRDQAPER